MARLLRAVLVIGGVIGAAGCGTSQPAADIAPLPLPTAGIAGREVTVYPLTLIATALQLNWSDAVGPRREALARADSLLHAFLVERAPEVTWIAPEALRQAARQAPGMVADPDRMATAMLRSPGLSTVPDPLRSQMRVLTGVAGDRYALVPASLRFVIAPEERGRAELTLVLADVRLGTLSWRTVAQGEGDDPWAAMREALNTLVPDLP